MTTNVSEKERLREDTLREIIDYCKARSREEQDSARSVCNYIAAGWILAESRAYDRIAEHCVSMLNSINDNPKARNDGDERE